MKLNNKKDLTRWNRAGLTEFKYVDGNAITYLETLRLQLLKEFDNGKQQQWKELEDRFVIPPNETRLQTSKRLTTQYYDERRDYAWEILRSFSRSSHVLGEYINAYANEAYLPTATEWDNVRKLVALLNYSPAPPASAETTIALLLKQDKSGTVEKGFAVKNKPDPGEPTIFFETQQKLEGNSLVNQLQLKDWNKNLTPLKQKLDKTVDFYLDNVSGEINVGDLGVLATPKAGRAVKVSAIKKDTTGDFVELTLLTNHHIDNFTLNESTLYLQAEFVSSPLANGINSVKFSKETGLTKNEIIFSKKDNTWSSRKVLKNELRHIEFNHSPNHPQVGEEIYKMRTLKRQSHPDIEGGGPLYLLPGDFTDDQSFFIDKDLNELPATVTTTAPIYEFTRNIINDDYGDEIFYPDNIKQGSVQQANLSEICFAGKTSKLESATWALVHQKDDTVTASLIDNIDIDEEWFTLKLEQSLSNVSLLRSAFKLTLKYKDYDINSKPAWSNVTGDPLNDSATILKVENPALIKHLSLGQKLICTSEAQSVVVELKKTTANSLHVTPAFHQTPEAKVFTLNNTVIYANAVKATHGETQPEKIVGNGDASQTNQQFNLTSDKISWVADAAFSTGVHADLSLRVGQRTWLQVEDLSLSTAEDHHYQVKVNEDNMLSICFGDGRHGRQLPTGIDNIRVRYRNGYGEEGNLQPDALVKIARPHLLVEDFVAPLISSGGTQKESASSMRESAPATVLTLSRAVSLDDFTHLAAHHSMVWQARAFEIMPDRPAPSKIEVVIVAAGGKEFLTDSESSNLIQNFLRQHSVPGTTISVVSFQALFMKLNINIMVDESAFDKKQVEDSVLEHLKIQLEIKRRQLGQALFRNDIIALIEQVEGVENASCEILANSFNSLPVASKPILHKGVDGKIRKVSIKRNQLIYLDMDKYPVQISSVAYEI